MNKILLIALSLVFAAASCNIQKLPYHDGTVEVAGEKISIELAETQQKRTLGLSGRESLKENQGMLFVFEQPFKAGFWMKDMLFPLDMVWIRDNRIVDISTNALPEPGKSDYELTIYSPKTEIDSVLELNAGWAKQNNLSVGDEVKIKLEK